MFMKSKTLLPFLLITFLITWLLGGLYIIYPNGMREQFGELNHGNPLFLLAVYSPAIAAFFLILKDHGVSGLKKYLSRLRLWRVSIGWYCFIFFGTGIIYLVGALLKGVSFTNSIPKNITPTQIFLGVLLMIFSGPMEEFGWRGVALPLLQRKLAPLWAGLLLGVIWGIWHIPAFYIGATPQSNWQFLPFFIGTVCVSVIMTPLFNKSKGSILLPMLFHWQLVNPAYPDAAPHDTIVFFVVACAIVFIYRKEMFTKLNSHTKVLG